MEIHVETKGLQEFEKALRESGKGIKPLANEILRGTFDKLVQNARKRADKGGATGTLVSAIKLQQFLGIDSPSKLIGSYGVTEEGAKHKSGAYIRGTMSDDDSYAFFVEVGRKPGAKRPSGKDIARWLTQKHWTFKYKAKGGREASAEFRNLPTNYQWLIAKAFAATIADKGIAGRHFMFASNDMTMHNEDIDIIDFDVNHLADRIAARLAHEEGMGV